MGQSVISPLLCSHCGEKCISAGILLDDKSFCCEGCKLVYGIINQSGLCNYYDLNKMPGITQRIKVRKDKFSFLDDDRIAAKLISFKDEQQTHITFYLPQMHCSSCLYLLENLRRLNEGVVSSSVNFTRKEAEIIFLHNETSLRKVAELLTAIGYEPYISLNNLAKAPPAVDKSLIYQLGIAGFCFSNIMLLSFPEYLGVDASEEGLRNIFRRANLLLSLPVFFYSALPFYQSSWKSLKHQFLNIDAPIALAVIITFVRSVAEVLSGTGGGYFDSMSGIVFFMLVGRVLQDKTYRQLSFERDYTSYFPIAVAVLKNNKETPVLLPDIKINDTLLIHNEELIPADGILTRGKAFIDYSFVTGESLPVRKEMGEMVYAGGRQTAGNIEILTVKAVAQSYLTRLWNRGDRQEEKGRSFVHGVSKYFTLVVFTIAAIAAVYWQMHDAAKIWPAVTAVFIIACPCALLLANSFTNGHILRILGRNRFYLRKAGVIEDISRVTHIVFDKTGTLTDSGEQKITYEGTTLSAVQKSYVAALASCSNHPLSKAVAKHLGVNRDIAVQGFTERPGEGTEGFVNDVWISIGAQTSDFHSSQKPGTVVYISIENKTVGCFRFSNHYRPFVPALLQTLRQHYPLSVISGDNAFEKDNLQQLAGERSVLLFHQKPEHKLEYIRQLQQKGEKVMMIGDGLNDAGALQQSDTGIAVSAQTNNFTPASDGIIAAEQLGLLGSFIRLCRINRKIVIAGFVMSVAYNIIGLYFAVQGTLSPLIAAILMPSSALSIVLLTFWASNMAAVKMKLER
ncbi:heavy metal translocating P-type ATPase [Agriterribacter sp.]|uniref:heavy metal translocating P-type ATPase n=1 Tax=Agriterribacter sp. TaxID=2821509 RepID=UPI002B5C08BE|nr:heavy metal translocating P-type ATPase metal-binding domain-containing protein [Agriterribacter sp.]HTN05967.1 heavy metal translocating P-type ATPase metal-binding domain-containing protein [Agriterribacter sp.]